MSEPESRSNISVSNKTILDLSLLRETTLKLLEYCRKNDWAGYDPYDALNSKVFRSLPFLDIKMVRLILTQAVKRSPINLRPLLLVPKTQNPKGIALFLSSLVKLKRIGLTAEDSAMGGMADRLLALRSPEKRYSAWGYSFDWQTRTYLVPNDSPNIICTTFAGNALLDVFEYLHEPSYLETALATADFILERLFWTEGTSTACFSYTPLERTKIHNANLLGAAFLCRVSLVTGERKFLEPALDAARYSIAKQHVDGAWDYGEAPSQRWIDNFHTGFNLVALRRISEYGQTTEFESSIRRGFDFYKAHFFREDGAPKYFHNATHPIDIHSVAQSLITLVEFRDFGKDNIDLAESVLAWTLRNMWDKRDFFYFQKHARFMVRTSFMRWSQAWMLLALSTLLAEHGPGESQ